MTPSTEMLEGFLSRIAVAIQMSRSVIIPTTFRSSLIIGKIPQSFSHIVFAASAKLSVIQIALASGVITSLTFIMPPNAYVRCRQVLTRCLFLNCRAHSFGWFFDGSSSQRTCRSELLGKSRFDAYTRDFLEETCALSCEETRCQDQCAGRGCYTWLV